MKSCPVFAVLGTALFLASRSDGALALDAGKVSHKAALSPTRTAPYLGTWKSEEEPFFLTLYGDGTGVFSGIRATWTLSKNVITVRLPPPLTGVERFRFTPHRGGRTATLLGLPGPGSTVSPVKFTRQAAPARRTAPKWASSDLVGTWLRAENGVRLTFQSDGWALGALGPARWTAEKGLLRMTSLDPKAERTRAFWSVSEDGKSLYLMSLTGNGELGNLSVFQRAAPHVDRLHLQRSGGR